MRRLDSIRLRYLRLLVLRLIFALAILLTWIAPHRASAEDVEVPVDLQVMLVTRVAAYDRNFSGRAGQRVLVWILVSRGNADSERVGKQLESAWKRVPFVAGLPVTVRTVDNGDPEKLKERYRRDAPTVLMLSAGFADAANAVAKTFDGASLLTVAAIPRCVDDGNAVLGIESRSGKPALVVHLERARHQQVAFKPELLKLARVIR